MRNRAARTVAAAVGAGYTTTFADTRHRTSGCQTSRVTTRYIVGERKYLRSETIYCSLGDDSLHLRDLFIPQSSDS